MNVRPIASAAAVIVVVATSSAGAQQGVRGGAPSAWTDVLGFNIVLVVGEADAGSPSATALPAGAKKALDDMREFLPYRHYRVLDQKWISCCSANSPSIAGKLEGVVAVATGKGSHLFSYDFTLTIAPGKTGIPVRFVLRPDEPGAKFNSMAAQTRQLERAAERADVEAKLESLQAQINEMRSRVEVGVMSPRDLRVLTDQHASLERRLTTLRSQAQLSESGDAPVIDSSFTMQVGETVVVGTSTIQGGGRALIALLTAVPQRHRTAR